MGIIKFFKGAGRLVTPKQVKGAQTRVARLNKKVNKIEKQIVQLEKKAKMVKTLKEKDKIWNQIRAKEYRVRELEFKISSQGSLLAQGIEINTKGIARALEDYNGFGSYEEHWKKIEAALQSLANISKGMRVTLNLPKELSDAKRIHTLFQLAYTNGDKINAVKNGGRSVSKFRGKTVKQLGSLKTADAIIKDDIAQYKNALNHFGSFIGMIDKVKEGLDFEKNRMEDINNKIQNLIEELRILDQDFVPSQAATKKIGQKKMEQMPKYKSSLYSM